MNANAINALGFVEVRGLPAAIETADCMLKTAQVRLLRQIGRDPAQISLIVEGELGACRAAVDAGKACAQRLGACIAGHVIGRPAGDTGDFVLVLAERGRRPFGDPPAVALDPERVLAELARLPLGCGAKTLARRLGLEQEVAAVEACLEALVARGAAVKGKGRYRSTGGGRT